MPKVESKQGAYEADLLPLRDGKKTYCRDCREEIRFVKSPRGTATLPVSEIEEGKYHIHFEVCEAKKVPDNSFDPQV